MAIIAGDEIALKRVLVDPTLAVRGNVLFGLALIVDEDSLVTVIWENGVQPIDTIASDMLDKITGENAPQDVVTFLDATSGVNSPEFAGTIVRRYTRQTDGTGATPSFTLVRLLSNQRELVEIPTGSVSSLAGR
jgi:hypothetical protein